MCLSGVVVGVQIARKYGDHDYRRFGDVCGLRPVPVAQRNLPLMRNWLRPLIVGRDYSEATGGLRMDRDALTVRYIKLKM